MSDVGYISDRSAVKVLIDLSVGNWRLSRLFARLLSKLDAGDSTRYVNQCRYYIKRMGESLKVVGLFLDSRAKQSTGVICTFFLTLCCNFGNASASDLSQTIEIVRPSIVAVGTILHTRAPPANFLGTGFAVGDGLHIITNAHVVPQNLNAEKKESLAIFIGRGALAKARSATIVEVDVEHDLALLKISGEPLPPLVIGDSDTVKEGETVAFTGFPIGMVLGLYPVTHQAIISAITPIVIPALSTKQLDINIIKRLRTPYLVFQLDGTAYPGNSGSPMFDPKTGKVIGILNMVFVKGTKENVLAHPSGISYAIPSNYIHAIMKK
ncbi:S1 family peptidase [Candidatus Nitrotoga sp. 1052]|uniref:S1 family peptidase n=1 Tax=Candidatus Nitrotoga sp. 1052 TaxID=2886964 RepID=UPI001EF4AFCD|nr:serine protease [Candidatus Nitrotoga sp. 1052]CAH1079383.1 Serine protease precursor MucD/AlgY associated with sigma factor RpoE [Candidatus Nitrotoga sp. 1052]